MAPIDNAAEKRAPVYSAACATRIEIADLPSTRFVEQNERRYPYRDAIGRINLQLVNSSLAEAEVDGAAEATVARLQAWQRHAVRALTTRPKDESITIDEIAAESDDSDDKEPPGTVAMRRRLFRPPRSGDEPLFDFDEPPDVDRRYVCQLVESATSTPRKTSPSRRRRHATRSALAVDAEIEDAEGAEAEEHEVDEDDEDEDDEDDDESSSRQSDVYEVEAVLDEDESGSKGFLIRWAGFSEEHNSWEPEWNLAPHLVEEFRKERRLVRSHQCDDYMLGRKRMLWCGCCKVHFSSDSFSQLQRRAAPAKRACLVHHYRGEKATLPKSQTTGAPVAASAATTPMRPTPQAARKRPRPEERSPPQPPPPMKARPVIARTLNHRQAAMDMRVSRLFGFGSL